VIHPTTACGDRGAHLDNCIAEAQNFVARSAPFVVWEWPTANVALCVMEHNYSIDFHSIMNSNTERQFTSSSDAFISLNSYKSEGTLRVSDSHSSETVVIKGFSTSQLRSAVSGYVSGLKYHDHEAAQAVEFCEELLKTCQDVIERLSPETQEAVK